MILIRYTYKIFIYEMEKIDNFDNYEVSELGIVRSVDTTVVCKNNRKLPLKGKVLHQYLNRKGYLTVNIRSNSGKYYKMSVHRLVANAFIPNPDNLMCVNHKDENKSNNRVSNLEWCTNNYNINYGTRNKRISKSNINNTKTSKEIIQMDINNNILRVWPSMNQIKRELNYSPGSIYNCCKGIYKKAYGFIWRYKLVH